MKKFVNYGVLVIMAFTFISCHTNENRIDYVDVFIGTGGDANLIPVASVPYGLVQMGADMYLNNSGLRY